MTQLTLLTEIPAPYRIPLFNALTDRVDLHVRFLRQAHPERPYDLHRGEIRFDWTVVPGVAATLRGHWLVVNIGIGRSIRADVVMLGGWNQPAFWEALAWCRARRIPVVLWTESTGADWRSGRLDLPKRLLLRAPATFVVPGSAAREYLADLGVEPHRIHVAPNAVDATVFGQGVRTRTDKAVRIVAVGRLAREKGIDTLLEAVRGLQVDVVLAGSGPEEARLRELAGPNVTFLGNVERNALPDVYANADIAVMPSRSDPWGMILNEASLAGLPLVSTTAAGAAWELIEDGVNGFRVAPDDPVALREALVKLTDDAELRRSAGARSRAIAARFTPDAWADAVVASVSSTLAQHRWPS